jgi:capsular polysaccharide biosynthesis protein
VFKIKFFFLFLIFSFLFLGFSLEVFYPKGLKKTVAFFLPEKTRVPQDVQWAKDYTFDNKEKIFYLHEEGEMEYSSIKELSTNLKKVKKKSPKSFVASLKKARVLRKDGEVITKDEAVFLDSVYQSTDKIKEHELLKKWFLPPYQYRSDKVAVIASGAYNCYYHWMVEVLPRLELIRQSGLSFDKLYAPELIRPFQRDSLSVLGIKESDLLEAEKNTHVMPEELIVTSLPTIAIEEGREEFRGMAVPKWVVEFLKESFLEKNTLSEKKYSKIYISRQAAYKRRLLNEESLIKELKQRGFEILLLENLKVKEQAKIFNSAKLIVAPHGAGLTNLVFSEPETKVIEIFHPEYLSDCYYHLSQLLSLRHDYVVASPSFSSSYRAFLYKITKKDSQKDILIDLPKLLEKIDQSV